MATHTSEIQEQRFWSQPLKFNGLNGNFIAFMGELRKELNYQATKQKEGSRQNAIIERCARYITVICNHKLASSEEIEKNKAVQQQRLIIKHCPLPAKRNKPINKIKVPVKNDNGIIVEVEIWSDMELEPASERGSGFPQGWLDTDSEREVSEYLKNIIESSLYGPALTVVTSMGLPRDRTGFSVIDRLANVYGRNSAMISMLPHSFDWTAYNDLEIAWQAYETLLDSNQYLELHPNQESIMGFIALQGFSNFDYSYRVIDHIRSKLGDNPSWSLFKEAMSQFLGDTQRNQFQQSFYRNDNGLQAMTAAGVLEDCPQINAVRSQFQNKNLRKGKGKENQKSQSSDNNNQNKNQNSGNNQNQNQNSGNNQKSKSKSKTAGKKSKYTPGKTKCTWCASVEHRDSECKTKGNGKWDKKPCFGCGGVAHPIQLCPNPILKTK